MTFIDYQEFVDAMKEADEAMQKALKALPAEASNIAAELTTSTFRDVRATLVMAHGMQREMQDKQERRGR